MSAVMFIALGHESKCEGLRKGDLQITRDRLVMARVALRKPARVTIPDQRAKITAANTATNRASLIVIRPLKSPDLAVENGSRSKPLNRDEIKWRRGWDSNPRKRR
jgi:hypothetical protein